ncbi:MAG: hypothetical protein ACI4N1_09210 [Stenotrophomonas koreensis]
MSELLMPAGRLWQRLRRQLPADMALAGWWRWPRPLHDRRMSLQLARPWSPQAADLAGGWQWQGRRWCRQWAGWCWWLSADGRRLYACRRH